MQNFPHELAFGDVYFSPLLLVIILAFIATAITTLLLNKLKLSRYFIFPSLSFLVMMTLYIVMIDRFWIKF